MPWIDVKGALAKLAGIQKSEVLALIVVDGDGVINVYGGGDERSKAVEWVSRQYFGTRRVYESPWTSLLCKSDEWVNRQLLSTVPANQCSLQGGWVDLLRQST